jgi:hypothetical protein
VVLERRVVRHREGDRGDGHLERHALGRDVPQHLVEVEATVEANGRAGLGGGEQVEEPEDVRRRRRDLEAVVRAEPQRRAPVPRGGADRRVGVTNGLGQARGAGAEHEDRLVLVVARRRRHRVARVRDGRGGDLGVVQVEHLRAAQVLGEHRGARVVAHAEPSARQREGVADLPGLPRGAEQHGRRAQPADGVDREHELDAVREHHGHAVALADSVTREVARERVAQRIELPEGPPLVAGPDGVAVAVPVRAPLEGAVEEGPVHHVRPGALTRARSSSLTTLPVAFTGSSSTISMARGTL